MFYLFDKQRYMKGKSSLFLPLPQITTSNEERKKTNEEEPPSKLGL